MNVCTNPYSSLYVYCTKLNKNGRKERAEGGWKGEKRGRGLIRYRRRSLALTMLWNGTLLPLATAGRDNIRIKRGGGISRSPTFSILFFSFFSSVKRSLFFSIQSSCSLLLHKSCFFLFSYLCSFSRFRSFLLPASLFVLCAAAGTYFFCLSLRLS